MRLTNGNSTNGCHRHEHIHVQVVFLEETDGSIAENHPAGNGQYHKLQDQHSCV